MTYIGVQNVPLGNCSWWKKSKQNVIDHLIDIFATEEI